MRATLARMLLLSSLAACAGRQGAFPEDAVGDPGDVPAAEVPDTEGDAPDADARVPVPRRGFCEPNDAPFPVRPAVAEAPTLPLLRVSGRDVVTPDGTPVALRGVNFGSWLQMESWIPGIGPVFGDEFLAATFVKADDFGVRDLFDAAFETVAGEWALELRSPGPLVDEMRGAMYAATDEERESAVDAFWAWFDQVPWVFEEQSMWEWLGRRHGWDRAGALREAFAEAWITEVDVQRVKALGLNLVRVPVWYDALETDLADGPNGFRPEGWRHLDDVALWARRHGVYLAIDLHGAPGGQGVVGHQGLRDGGHLFREPACVAKTARLWKALAAHFDGDPHVAILDLLNEPMSSGSSVQYRDVHDALYRAIREADTDASFIVMAEDGYRAGADIASPSGMGWTNAMFSIHLYPPGATDAAAFVAQVGRELQIAEGKFGYGTRFACPLLLGEFAASGGDAEGWADEAMDGTMALLNARGVHWTAWTWKFHRARSAWGVYAPVAEGERRLDVSLPYEALKAAFEGLTTASFVEFREYAAALSARAADPVRPLDLAGDPQER